MRASVLAVFAAMLIAAPAVAQDDGEQSEKKSEPKICKVDRATGSLARRNKVCLTREQWRQLNSRTRDEIDSYTSRMGNREGAGQAGGGPG